MDEQHTSGWEIEVWNVQTIPHFKFWIPLEGIVKFSGDNNDGKSIVRKFFYDTVGCQLHIKDNRYCLINDNEDFARMVIRKLDTGIEFEAYAHRESSKTYYELRLKGQEPIRRYIKDKGLETIVYDAGFHYLEKREFSLNVHPANTPNLFETTSAICNKEVYDSATEDPELNLAIENVQNVIAEIKSNMEECQTKMAISYSKINTSVLVDETEEMKRVMQMQALRKNIEAIYPMEILELKSPPTIDNISTLSVDRARDALLNLRIPAKELGNLIEQLKALKDIPKFSNAYESMKDYRASIEAKRAEVCVVCGRGVFDDVESHCAS